MAAATQENIRIAIRRKGLMELPSFYLTAQKKAAGWLDGGLWNTASLAGRRTAADGRETAADLIISTTLYLAEIGDTGSTGSRNRSRCPTPEPRSAANRAIRHIAANNRRW
jgi:hypothetical protein